jgi:hypothetical protein
MLSSETAVAVEHGYFSKTMLFPELKLNGAIGDATTNVFTVDKNPVCRISPQVH